LFLKNFSNRIDLFKLFVCIKYVELYFFFGINFKLALVIIPKIPSEPQNNFHSFGPKLSFLSLFKKFKFI